VAGKKQAVLMELLSRYKKTGSGNTGLEVPPWYRRAAGAVDARRAKSTEPEDDAAAPDADAVAAAPPATTPSLPAWPEQARAMEAEFMGMMSGRSGTATLERSPFDPQPEPNEPEPAPTTAEPVADAPEPAPVPACTDSPSRAGAWFRETWGKLRRKLTFRKAPGPIPQPGPASDRPTAPDAPAEQPQTGETAVEGLPAAVPATTFVPTSDQAPMVTLSPGYVQFSLSYPLVGIGVLCLMLLCGICFLLGKSAGERSRVQRPATAGLSEAGDQARPAPAADVGTAQPAVGRLITTSRRVDRAEGAYYLVLAGLPDVDWGRRELQRAGKWLKDNYGIETTLETVHTNYLSLVMVDGFTEAAGPEVEAAQRLIEACDREYAHLGGCTFKGPYTRRFPWGSAE
jgi:hypothetical protein